MGNPQQQGNPPDTLPANFGQWDKPPDTLPADFGQWDQAKEATRPKGFGGNVHDLAQETWNQVNPVSTLKGLAQATSHPVDTYLSDSDVRQRLFDKGQQIKQQANEEWSKGNYLKAIDMHMGGIAHTMYSMIPFFGPQLDSAGEDFQNGNWGSGMGKSIGMGLNMAGPAYLSGRFSIGKPLYRAGQALSDYAPQVGSAVEDATTWGGRAGAVEEMMHGRPGGAVASLGTQLIAPKLGELVQAGATKAGSGLKWLGNLLSADASGIQPFPLTKSVLNNRGLMQEFQQHLNSPETPGSGNLPALPPASIELPPSSSGAAPEGVLPAQKILVRDPKSGQIKVMYGSGSGPTLYQLSDSVLQKTQDAESGGSLPKSKAVSDVMIADQPYIKAAQDELRRNTGRAPQWSDVYPLAQKLKDQDSFVSQTLDQQLAKVHAQMDAAGIPRNSPPAAVTPRPTWFGATDSRPAVQPTAGSGSSSPTDLSPQLQYMMQAKNQLGPNATLKQVTDLARKLSQGGKQ